jgi:DNA-directed RNA polymerase subunit RPC12/RpoP
MKLRFFCEQCGTEVPKNTVRCPSCGRYFTAIQCPQCGYRGSEEDFAAGCPTCGYMRPREVGAEDRGTAAKRKRSGKKGRRGRSAAADRRVRGGAAASAEVQGPSRTVYTVLGIVLLVLLGTLIAVLLLL